jgi:hypothetical protein
MAGSLLFSDVPQDGSVLIGNPQTGQLDMAGVARAWNLNAQQKAAEERAARGQAIINQNQGNNPFVTVRNPAIRTAITRLFDEASAPATLAPARITATTRNPGQATKINALGQQVDTANKVATTSLTDFVKQQLANRPAAQLAAQQEADAAGAYYRTGPGSVQDQLARQSIASKAAINNSVRQAMNLARRGDSMRRMTSGNNSYNDAVYGDVTGRIAADSARKKAEIDRQNLLYLLEGKKGMTGVRSKILEDLARRELAPADAYRTDASQRSALLSSLLNLEDQNTIYEKDDPETRLLKKLGLISGLTEVDLARQRYEV